MKWRSRGRPHLSGSVGQIRVRPSLFLLLNARKASLGFGGSATNSKFAEFLLHFPSEETFQTMRLAEFFFIKPLLACRIQSHSSCVSKFSTLFKWHFSIWLCRVLAPDEFRDAPRYLDPFLSSTPAVGSKRSWSAPNVIPMRLPKRNTLTFTVAVRSIPKCVGSIKIDISKQNRSDQLFEFQTEERIFHCGDVQISTNLRCAIIDAIFVVSNNRHVSIYFSNTIFCGQFRNWDWPFHAISFRKKIHTTEAAMEDKIPFYALDLR